MAVGRRVPSDDGLHLALAAGQDFALHLDAVRFQDPMQPIEVQFDNAS
jgi:hypothetical protein